MGPTPTGGWSTLQRVAHITGSIFLIMLNAYIAVAAAFVIAIAHAEDSFARGGGHSSGYLSSSGSHYVHGYTRRDGTYVSPHYRSSPDGIQSNNRSYSPSYGTSPSYNAPNQSSPHSERSTYDDVKKQIGSSRSTPGYRGDAYGHGAERDESGRIKRSAAAKSDFKSMNPCPSTGATSGACPGYVIDHVTPLKRGGADAPSNMQWQTTAEAKAKDKWE